MVVGPEATGTRMVTDSLIKAGVYGQSTHEQEMDDLVFTGRPDLIVLRRSVPHGDQWPDLTDIIRRMSEAGYAVSPIMTLRDKDFCIQSQLRTAHKITAAMGVSHLVSEPVARAHYFMAYKHIFGHLSAAAVMPVICHYASFVNNAEFRSLFFQQLGLPCPVLDLYDANLKYTSAGMKA